MNIYIEDLLYKKQIIYNEFKINYLNIPNYY